MLKDSECKKGQLSQQPLIPYILVVDVVTPKEDPAMLKVKLPDDSHISVPIFSRGNNEEYIAHIVAVLRIIVQKGLPKKCRVCSAHHLCVDLVWAAYHVIGLHVNRTIL